MSYSIFYRSMFVKLSNNKYIPMMEMGDNNVYEVSYGRGKAKRVRSWSNANLNRGQKFFTHDEIVSSLNSWYNESEQKRNRDKESGIDWKVETAKSGSFGYYEAVSVYGKHTTDTTFNHVKNLVLSGEKNCISFEEAVKVCGLNIYYWEDSKNGGFPQQKYISFETEEEMFSRIEEMFGEGKNYFFEFSFYANKMYERIKAKNGFLKMNGKQNPFILMVNSATDKKYVSVNENNDFVLTDDISKAKKFNKYSCEGVDIYEFFFNLFPGASSIRFIYERDLKNIA